MNDKCIVYGCVNHSSEGGFKGDLCLPCYKFLSEGRIGNTTSFLGELVKENKKIRDKLRKDSAWWGALEQAGVDNWEGYEDAQEIYEQMEL